MDNLITVILVLAFGYFVLWGCANVIAYIVVSIAMERMSIKREKSLTPIRRVKLQSRSEKVREKVP